jgi:drug/metabolite transporter (DMT)-like permease
VSFPLGEVASLGAAACWAVGLTLYRRDVKGIGARQVNLYKGIQGTALFLVSLVIVGATPMAAEAQLYLAASGVVGLALGDSLLFAALARLGPHRAALFGLLGPLLTAAGGWLLLDEGLRLVQIVGVVLAMAGVTLVIRARPEAARAVTARGVAYGVGFAVCQAAGALLAKRGLSGVDALPATTIRLAAATAVLAMFAFARGELGSDLRRLFRPGPLSRMVPAVFFGTFLGLWLMQVGIKYTQTAVANALHSTTPLFTLPIALFLLRERLGVFGVVGSLVGVGGVALLLLG